MVRFGLPNDLRGESTLLLGNDVGVDITSDRLSHKGRQKFDKDKLPDIIGITS